MNRVELLRQLKGFSEEAVKDLVLPTSLQKGDTEQGFRAAEVFCGRLPDVSAAKKKAPYILHQLVTGKDVFPSGRPASSTAVVRSVFCVWHEDGQEGSLALLNLMERVRIALLRQAVIGRQFRLDIAAGLEALVYTEPSAPYYLGEMLSVWELPVVLREVNCRETDYTEQKHGGA